MKYYPINLNLEGKKAVVVGGGKVAERKVMQLLECGAKVTVISPKVTKKIRSLADKSQVNVIDRKYRVGDLKGAVVAIAATDNPAINKQVPKEARKRRVLINVVDSPELCDFIMPSIIRRGDLVISISTSGKFPFLSKKLRIMLEGLIGEEYGIELDRLAGLRNKLKTKISPLRHRG